MQIQSVDNFQKTQPNFKKAYPVMHWITENGNRYSPVTNFAMNKKLQSQIVRVLNKPIEKTNKPVDIIMERFKAFISSNDADYRFNSVVRSFYNRFQGEIGNIKPVTYLITGGDVACFDDLIAKNIGKAKGIAKENMGESHLTEIEAAVDQYNRKGLDYVNEPIRRLTDSDGVTYVLHTKFKTIRNKAGKIKGYRFLDAKFLPEKGPKNPLERLGFSSKSY